MFRPHARVIEAGTDRMCLCDLASGRLEYVCADPMEYARLTLGERRAVLVGFDTWIDRINTPGLQRYSILPTFTASFNPDQPYGFTNKVVERPNRVTSPTDTSNQRIRQLTFRSLELLLNLPPDDTLEVPDDSWEGVRADGRTDEVVCCREVGYPVTHSFVDCVLQGLGTSGNRDHL